MKTGETDESLPGHGYILATTKLYESRAEWSWDPWLYLLLPFDFLPGSLS